MIALFLWERSVCICLIMLAHSFRDTQEHLHISIESILRLSGDFKIWRRIFENESSMNWTLVVSTLLFTVNLSLSRQSSGEGWLSYREKLCIRALCVCPYTWMQQVRAKWFFSYLGHVPTMLYNMGVL